MPKATRVIEGERHDLKSLPGDDFHEGGYVVLRQMSYDEFLERRSFTSDMRVKQGKGQQDFEGIMQLMNKNVTVFEFKTCIVEHNLEDDDGSLLDFSKPHSLKKLDPRVGEEISSLIDKMNQFDEEGEEKQGN